MTDVMAAETGYELDAELARLRRDGSLIRMKLGMVFEHVVLPYMAQAIRSPNVPDSTKIQLIDRVAKLGNLEPKPEQFQPGAGGPQFGVVINLPGGQGQVSIAAGQTPAPSPPPEAMLSTLIEGELSPALSLGPPPAYVAGAFELRDL